MVSTRGGARTSGADEEPALTLRKKPVRKAATTTKTTKTSKAAPVGKATRAKKTAPEPEPDQDDEELDELQQEEPVAAPKVTRKAGARAKKDETNNAAASKPAPATKARSTTSRAATTRTAKLNVEEEAAELPPPTQPKAKATRTTRATASTRATAAKEKAPPLSPKKITQVQKAPARGTRNVASKADVVKKVVPAAATGRPTTRRRNISDENAGIPDLRPSTADRQREEEAQLKQASESKLTFERALQAQTIDIDNETPMSTGPTTPADSPPPDLDDAEEELAAEVDESEQESQESDADVSREMEVSGDELCGPKTPMKRLSPRELAKHASAQKNIRPEDVPMKTPTRRFIVLGSQRGTPQTQKPYCKPSAPLSDVRPMTVARARDRAMVFPKLQPFALPDQVEEQDEAVQEESTPLSADFEDVDMDASEVLMVPSEDSVEVARADEEQHPESVIRPVYGAGFAIDEERDLDMEDSEVLLSHHEDHSMSDDVEEDHSEARHEIVTIPFQMKSIAMEEPNVEEQIEAVLAEEDDPNATILVEQEEQEGNLSLDGTTSTRSDESVIIRRDETFAIDIDESIEDLHLPATTPKPETIVWENIREDVTIPFNFSSALVASREASTEDSVELSNVSPDSEVEATDELGFGNGAVDNKEPFGEDELMVSTTSQHQRQSFGNVRQSVDATVNLSDFIDVSSLAERLPIAQPEAQSEDDAAQSEDVFIGQTPPQAAIPVEVPSTSARESLPSLPSVPQDEPQHMPDTATPHYAIPTIAFRRKSLPAISYHTPMKTSVRPMTADGASMPRIANPFINLWKTQSKSRGEATPFRGRPSTSYESRSISRTQTPSARTPLKSPVRKTPRTSNKVGLSRTPRASQTPRTSGRLSVRPTPQERFPGLPSRQTYEELAITPAAKNPFVTTPLVAKSVTKERFPGLPRAETYEELADMPVLGNPPAAETTPQIERATVTAVEHVFTPQQEQAPEHVSTPQPEERYPGLPHRRTYEEHARTAMPPARFRTPSQSPAKRPATVQRPASLRKVALKASTPKGSRTPIKTPLRAPAMTPGQVPLTPHPGAPLKGVNAYVDVYLNDGSSANSTYVAVLHSLGAKTTKTFNDRVTHVVFKEGSPTTLQRLRLHNKQVAESGTGNMIFCVNGRWVNDSNSEGKRMDENDEAYTVDIEDQPATKRRRKSMEPRSLLNIGGNAVHGTDRKSSLGRSSLGRALKVVESPSLDMKMSIDIADKENSGDSSVGEGSPATPAYLSAPDSLVQQTAPMNRMRKLDFDAKEQAKNRRLTFWDGGEF